MKLNNIDICYPSSFAIEPVLIAKKGQTTSGRATMELIARKKKFTLQWAMIKGPDYQAIVGILNTGCFWTFVYPADGSNKTVTVYTDSGIKAELQTRVGDWVYTNAELTLQEQ